MKKYKEFVVPKIGGLKRKDYCKISREKDLCPLGVCDKCLFNDTKKNNYKAFNEWLKTN